MKNMKIGRTTEMLFLYKKWNCFDDFNVSKGIVAFFCVLNIIAIIDYPEKFHVKCEI